MNLDRHTRLTELFHGALERPVDGREAYLESAAADDPELVREVLELLAADEGSEQARQLSSGAMPGTPALDAQTFPERVGRYRLIRPLGEGGMGQVHLARQENPEREVALKLLRWVSAGEALKRFEYEAELLGQMRHPGIAQVYESGIAELGGSQVPFFAMEYVDGAILDRYADRTGLDQRQRLELIARVCDAVEHAHRRGIVHRDLKPANVVVTADGDPKVLDFGIARTIDRDPARRSLLTQTGQLLGTVAYMAPEQARGQVADIDWRVDVHALGVMAYELVSGRRPYDFGTRGMTGDLLVLAENEPTPLSKRMPDIDRELSLLIAKAVEKDPERRYESARAFADDLRRYLRSEPIEARPPTAVYLFSKFVKRHRGLAVGASLAALSLTAGTTASVLWALRAEAAEAEALAAEQTAIDEACTANEAFDFVKSLFASAIPQVADGEELTVRQVLDVASSDFEQRFAAESLVAARIESLLGDARVQLGDFEEAAARLDRAIPVLEARDGPDHPRVLDALIDRAHAYDATGRADEARASLARVLDLVNLDRAEHLEAFVRAQVFTGEVALEAERLDEAELALSAAVEAADSGALGGRVQATALIARSGLRTRQERFDEALVDLDEALEVAASERSQLLLASIEILRGEAEFFGGDSQAALGCFERALALEEQVLDPLHPRLMTTLSNLASVHGSLGDIPKAGELLERAIAIPRAGGSVVPTQYARALQNYGNVCMARQDFAGAQEAWDEALDIWIEVAGPESRAAASLYESLAAVADAQGETERAAELRAKASFADSR